MWLIDVARELPTAQLDGFDIDSSQAPPQQWMPSNATLRYCNIFENLPDDLIGKYDFVHVRLLVLVIEQGDPSSVLRNLKMLKPGGYLQWDDIDCQGLCVETVDSSVEAPSLEQLRETSYANGRHDWVLLIPRIAREAGFEDVHLYYFGDGNELARAFRHRGYHLKSDFGK